MCTENKKLVPSFEKTSITRVTTSIHFPLTREISAGTFIPSRYNRRYPSQPCSMSSVRHSEAMFIQFPFNPSQPNTGLSVKCTSGLLFSSQCLRHLLKSTLTQGFSVVKGCFTCFNPSLQDIFPLSPPLLLLPPTSSRHLLSSHH